MLIRQLPFETVISRGADLQGLDKLLVPTAQSSFNMMVVGAIVGAVVGVVVGQMLGRRSSA
jgi:Na+/citrate or Na+/malate symporter